MRIPIPGEEVTMKIVSRFRERSRKLLGRLVLVTLPMLVFFLALEIILRFGAFLAFDHSRYHLFYGLHGLSGRVGVSPWQTYDGSHYKLPPRFVLEGAAGQADERATTNALGFRGPDFEPRKAPGSLRVVALGGSSTFGFHSPDNRTYPYLLSQELARRHGEGVVEVINAGFPYYNTASILSLLRAEVLAYEPDVLTLYTGYSDASWPLHVPRFARILFWTQERSITYLLLKERLITDQRVYSWKARIERLFPGAGPDGEALERQVAGVVDRYGKNLRAIVDLAEANGAALVFIRQPMTTRHDDPQRFASYEEEFEAVRGRVAKRGIRSALEFQMLVHHRLLEELDRLAADRDIPVVDNVALTDQERRGLAPWANLTAEANARLAQTLAEALEPFIEALEGARGAPGEKPANPASATVPMPSR